MNDHEAEARNREALSVMLSLKASTCLDHVVAVDIIARIRFDTDQICEAPPGGHCDSYCGCYIDHGVARRSHVAWINHRPISPIPDPSAYLGIPIQIGKDVSMISNRSGKPSCFMSHIVRKCRARASYIGGLPDNVRCSLRCSR